MSGAPLFTFGVAATKSAAMNYNDNLPPRSMFEFLEKLYRLGE